MRKGKDSVRNVELQRSKEGLAGGVCAGIAERFSIDPIITRILAVLICLISFGLGLIVYLVLWAALPLAPDEPCPVDVEVHEAKSETYGTRGSAAACAEACDAESPAKDAAKDPAKESAKGEVKDLSGGTAKGAVKGFAATAAKRVLKGTPKSAAKGSGAGAAQAACASRAAYASVAHEPPTPPLAARAAASAVAARIAAGQAPTGIPYSGASWSGSNEAQGGGMGAQTAASSSGHTPRQTVAVSQMPVASSKPLISQVPASPSDPASRQAAAVSSDQMSQQAAAVSSDQGLRQAPAGDFRLGAGEQRGGASIGPEAKLAYDSETGRASKCAFVLPPAVRSLAVWVVLAAVFLVLLRIGAGFIYGSDWWRFWPLFLAVTGIAVMVVPGKPGLRMTHAVTGWFLLVAGMTVLPMSLGLVRWASLFPWVSELWLFGALAVVFLIVGWLRRSWPWSALAAVLITVFCIGGLMGFAIPGEVPAVVIDLPFGRDPVLTFPFIYPSFTTPF